MNTGQQTEEDKNNVVKSSKNWTSMILEKIIATRKRKERKMIKS